MNKKIVLFVLCFTNIGNQLFGMQALHDSLTALKAKLTALAGQLETLSKSLPLESRNYLRDGVKIPIRFEQQDILSTYLNAYNKNNPTDQLDSANCQVVGGPFTYYNAHPQEDEAFKKEYPEPIFHEDIGWGCAWRASLNVLNKVQEWLEKKHAIKATKQRQVHMYDIKKWTNYPHKTWIEPSDNAELLLLFFEKWYKPEDQATIKTLLNFRGRLYLTDKKQKDTFISSLVSRQEARSYLPKLKAYLNVEPGSAPKDSVAETLSAFYSVIAKRQPVLATKFPAFNEDTHPFPLNVDDGTLARNIYGFHQQAGNISHLFIGETHVGYGGRSESPWLASGWEPINNIFNGNMMIFEVYVK